MSCVAEYSATLQAIAGKLKQRQTKELTHYKSVSNKEHYYNYQKHYRYLTTEKGRNYYTHLVISKCENNKIKIIPVGATNNAPYGKLTKAYENSGEEKIKIKMQ